VVLAEGRPEALKEWARHDLAVEDGLPLGRRLLDVRIVRDRELEAEGLLSTPLRVLGH
jgi:hypothetical protein